MHQIQVLTLEDTEKLLTMREVIARVEEVYREKAQGTAGVWPMIFHEFDPGKADMDIKSGYLQNQGVYGLKLVSWFGGNPAKGLPALTGAVMLFDSATGRPLGLINGEHMTGMRTGAAGAVGIKYLARPESEVLLMVGAGHQAAFQITAALGVAPNIRRVLVYDPMDIENARHFCNRFRPMGAEHTQQPAALLKSRGIVLEPVADLQQAVSFSDIIITATPSRKPLIMRDWVKPGTHFSCMGSDMSGKQEIDAAIVADARIVVDDIPQAIAVGEIEAAVRQGLVDEKNIVAEIGEIILGRRQGRTGSCEITVFDSTGIALQDLATGALALEKAAQTHIAAPDGVFQSSDLRTAVKWAEAGSIGAQVNF